MERGRKRGKRKKRRTGEGRSKRRKGRKERRLGWLGIARWYRGNSEGEETKQEGGRRKGGRRNGTRAQSEEREAFRALLPPSRSPSGTALFVLPSFARPRYIPGWKR